MTFLEICLLIAGIIMMLGSFFVTEKLSSKELQKFSDLSSKEIDIIFQTQMSRVEGEVKELIDKNVEEAVDKAQRPLEKITNEKIMAISEYSDTVKAEINKNHDEVMFLYNMLGDKQEDIKNMSDAIENSKLHIQSMLQKTDDDKNYSISTETLKQTDSSNVYEQKNVSQKRINKDEQPKNKSVDKTFDKKEEILKRYEKGMSIKNIARELCLGLGEVNLVIDLFKGDSK